MNNSPVGAAQAGQMRAADDGCQSISIIWPPAKPPAAFRVPLGAPQSRSALYVLVQRGGAKSSPPAGQVR